MRELVARVACLPPFSVHPLGMLEAAIWAEAAGPLFSNLGFSVLQLPWAPLLGLFPCISHMSGCSLIWLFSIVFGLS